MGHITHNALIITSWNRLLVEQARDKAERIGMAVSEIVESRVNRYFSIFIAPDGSKDGWKDNEVGDTQRAALRAWLDSNKYGDGSSSIEWCEVVYGNDDQNAEIVEHGWKDKTYDAA